MSLASSSPSSNQQAPVLPPPLLVNGASINQPLQLSGPNGAPLEGSLGSVAAQLAGPYASHQHPLNPYNPGVMLPPLGSGYPNMAIQQKVVPSAGGSAVAPPNVNSTSSTLPPLFKLVMDNSLTANGGYGSPAPGSMPIQSQASMSAAISQAAAQAYYQQQQQQQMQMQQQMQQQHHHHPQQQQQQQQQTEQQQQHQHLGQPQVQHYYYSPQQLPTPPQNDQMAGLGVKRKATEPAPSGGHPRKKRECPICHNYFSNLTTHKSIHNKNSKPYSCTTCSRAFKRLNDLIRHEKCHLSKLGSWEYHCPFHPGPQRAAHIPDVELCHQSGYFTRCDTYKNHLKAIHFKYPPNTLKSERSKVSGHCKECGMYFPGVQSWLKNHIETGQCPKIMSAPKK